MWSASTCAEERKFCCYGCSLAYRILGEQHGEGEAGWLLARLGLAAFLSMNVMLFSLVFYAGGFDDYPQTAQVTRALMVGLALPVFLILGGPFVQRALSECRAGTPGMATIIAIGSSAAFGFSLFAYLTGQDDLYLDTAVMILVVVTVGKFLEAQAKAQARSQLKHNLSLQPLAIRVLREGQTCEVSVTDLRVGDRMQLLPGDRIPVDGVATDGLAELDQSAVTGEAVPTLATVGHRVHSGSLLVSGHLTILVDGDAAHAVAWEMSQMIERAELSRMPIQRIADRLASKVVPLVLMLGAGGGVYWGLQRGTTQGISVALAVLLVSCPCALGLGGPLTAMVALSRAGTQGFILRSADVFERLASISVVCWDKTGTITSGRPHVRDVHCFNGVSQERLIALAGSLCRYSKHPFAQAIVACASGTPALPVCQSDWVIGKGARGKVMEGHIMTDVLVGNVSWMQERGLPQAYLESFEQSQLAGSDSVYCAIDRKLAGAFMIEDPRRQGVAEAVALLRTVGIRSVLLTGDREVRAKETAKAVGIPEAFGQLLPQDKINVIRALQSRGERVLMIGDGLNDAAALTQSDVGMAVSNAMDISKEQADVVLVNSQVQNISWLVVYSKQVYHTIKLNMTWALVYNVAGVSLALAGLLRPVIAATAMAMSSLIVVLTSCLLPARKAGNDPVVPH